jgi:phage shock protein PspC (stress-responsive transcriptional regulator)
MGLAQRDRWAWVREVERPAEGRLLAGVCAALAQRLTLDVTLLRLAFLVLALGSGLGLLLYLVLWMLLPNEDADRSARRGYREVVRHNLLGLGEDIRRSARVARGAWARTEESSGWPRPLSRRWIAIGLIGGGLLIFLYSLGVFAWLGPGRTLGLAIMAIGAAVLCAAPQWRR